MRYYIDTEFDESACKLISIGIVSQDNREFYAVNHEYERAKASPWLAENVVPLLFNLDVTKKSGIYQGTENGITREIDIFLGGDEDVQFWGYYCAWDIVLIHRLYGSGYQGVLAKNSKVPLGCYDLKQFAKSCGVSSLRNIVNPFLPEHHALVDARWNKFVHEQLIFQHGREV